MQATACFLVLLILALFARRVDYGNVPTRAPMTAAVVSPPPLESDLEERRRRIVDALNHQLETGDIDARLRAIQSLAYHKARESSGLVIDCFTDPNESIQEAAVAAMGQMADSKAVIPLVRTIDSTRNGRVQESALAALALIKADALPAIKRELQFSVGLNLDCAIRTSIKLGWNELIPTLLASLHSSKSKEIAEMFLNCGNENLHNGAVEWGRMNGYTPQSVTNYSGTVKWGSR